MNLHLVRKNQHGYSQIKFVRVLSFLQTEFDQELEINYLHKETDELLYAKVKNIVQIFVDLD